MNVEDEGARPQCPTCRGALVAIGRMALRLGETDASGRHAFWCPAGCRGPEADGTFEFIECPACGACDTAATPRGNGVEEVECFACGTIASVQIASVSP